MASYNNAGTTTVTVPPAPPPPPPSSSSSSTTIPSSLESQQLAQQYHQYQQQQQYQSQQQQTGQQTGAGNDAKSMGLLTDNAPSKKSINHDSPPFSRVFVVCSKSMREDEVQEAFSAFGPIEDIWMVKDRMTKENKGICYVKFERASSAAASIEALDGKVIGSDPKPIKVCVWARYCDSVLTLKCLNIIFFSSTSGHDCFIKEHCHQSRL